MERFKNCFSMLIILFIFWMLFTFDFTISNILTGLFMSGITCAISRNVLKDYKGNRLKIPNLIVLIKFFFRLIYEIYKASFIHIVRIIKKDSKPVIVEVDLEVKDPFIITIISNAITLTPGTITVDTDKNRLYVLSIRDDGEKGEQIKKNIKEKFEKLFLKEG